MRFIIWEMEMDGDMDGASWHGGYPAIHALHLTVNKSWDHALFIVSNREEYLHRANI